MAEPDDDTTRARKTCGSGGKVSEATIEKGVTDCLALIAECKAKHTAESEAPVALELLNQKLTSTGLERVAAALQAEESLPELLLNISNNKLGNRGAGIAARLMVGEVPLLRSLDLRMNRISELGAEQISLALRGETCLSELKLSSNDFGVAGATWVAAGLKENQTLTTLELEYNLIGDEGAEKLAEALRVNSSLTALHLRANEIEVKGAKSIASALESNQALRFLDISTNCIGDDGAAAFIQALQFNKTLQVLTHFGCEVERDVADDLRQTLQKNVAAADGTPAAAGNGYPTG
eukprot:TRINITY_DN124622_c0_g1_i1.p1 TRINITY_DN124622_c0_g1~~TRINITY_DN124622_c0_g1_i1.p1  ORF type:complete len:294 (+),score=62.22 TRINITY_DN124622_c0_g1_i1:64-945(+)